MTTTAYADQLIVQFLDGQGNDSIQAGSELLQSVFLQKSGKKCAIVTVNKGPAECEALDAALKTLDQQSRIYLRGHGDRNKQTLGGFSGAKVAGYLDDILNPIARISVTGCQLAQPQGDAAEMGAHHSVTSFAHLLFTNLTPKKVRTLTARWDYVGVTSQGDATGKKFTATKVDKDNRALNPVIKGANRKLLWYWEGNTPKCLVYDYSKQRSVDEQLALAGKMPFE